MASRIKERNNHGASLPKPPKCGKGKKPVWVEEKKDDKDPTKRGGGRRDDKKPIHGKGKWVCKTKPTDPDRPKPPKPHPNPYGPNDPVGPNPHGPKSPKRPRPVPPKMKD